MYRGIANERNKPRQILKRGTISTSLATFLLIAIWAMLFGSEQPINNPLGENGAWLQMGDDSASAGGISDNDGYSMYPSLAISPDGVPVIAWSDNSSANPEIYLRRWNGVDWEEMGSGSASGGGISDDSELSGSPSLAISPSGTVIVAWLSYSPSSGDVYFRRWNGSSWDEMGSTTPCDGPLSFAISPDDTPIIAWTNWVHGEIYVRRWNGVNWVEMGAGSASGGGISDNSGNSWGPSLAIGPDGSPLVAWSDDSGGVNEIYVRRWNGVDWVEMGAGSASNGGISDNNDHSRFPSLAFSPDGTPTIAWMQDISGSLEIYVRRWNGEAWVEIGEGSTSGGGISDTAGASLTPSLAISPDGSPIVAWYDDSRGNEEIYVRRWDGTAWVEIRRGSASGGGISANSGRSYAPSLAVGPDGIPIVAWYDKSGGDSEIYVRRWHLLPYTNYWPVAVN